MTRTFSPVLIGTLNRFEHFKRCVESLKVCKEAINTEVFIALDYPPADKYRAGYEKIKSYINRDMVGFKAIKVIERKVNMGARMNFMSARDLIFRDYDRIIVSEDDNEFSPDFLNYINQGLDVYEDRTDILAVCGYIYPVKFKTSPDDFFLYQGFSAWGYGIWRHKFYQISFDVNDLKSRFESKELRNKISSKNVVEHLKSVIKSGYITNDTCICFHQYIHDMKSVFPRISRVRNHGHDGSGLHCGRTEGIDVYAHQVICMDVGPYVMPSSISFDLVINQEIDNYLSPSRFQIYLNNPKLLFRNFLNRLIRLYS